MADKELIEIVRLCLSLDLKAYMTYQNFSQKTDDSELKSFWATMAKEEREHVGFWQTAFKLARQEMLPQLFDNPVQVREELLGIGKKVEALLASKISLLNISDSFLMAYRMEFYMMHPAFETLFQIVNVLGEEKKPENYYELHIKEFITAMAKFGAATPSLELLGETLQRLWQENRKLALQGSIDDLTGIMNRRGFQAIIRPLSHLALRNGHTVGVLMTDIDHFKKINDTYGHGKGDKVLKRVAEILKKNLRASDVVGRYGGEEFIIYLSQIEPASAFNIAEKLRRAVEQDQAEGIGVTISIGVSSGPLKEEVGESLMEQINRADACLYEAKRRGRNRVSAVGQELN